MHEREPKKRGPRLQLEERERTVQILRRLIHRGPPCEADPRIQGKRLAAQFSNAPAAQDALKLHLRNKVQPTPETTWSYGERLRTLGVPWCSGLWMLWATGRHADAVGTMVFWLQNQSDTNLESVDSVWQALALASRLASPTGLDRDFGFLDRHIHNDRLTTETYEALWAWARARAQDFEWALITRTYHAFIEREIAKTPWLDLVPLAADLQAAFDRWLTAGREFHGTLPLDCLAQATLAVAKSRLTLVDRETAVLVMLAQWLTGIEGHTQAPLYIRPINPEYDAPYLSEFGQVAPPMPLFARFAPIDRNRLASVKGQIKANDPA